MFVGAMCACLLDNTVGGATREQRGLRSRGIIHEISMDDDTYSYPPGIPFIKYFPCMPKEKRATNKVAEFSSYLWTISKRMKSDCNHDFFITGSLSPGKKDEWGSTLTRLDAFESALSTCIILYEAAPAAVANKHFSHSFTHLYIVTICD
ncbi:hypothetical protein OSTOST_24776 [Ostertagia ostertagi]